MSQLSLTKAYADGQLLYLSYIETMWSQLETKVNGGIDSDNIASGSIAINKITLSANATYTFGATDSGFMTYLSASTSLGFGTSVSSKDVIFKVENAEAARIDSTSYDFKVQKDVFFKDRSTAFGLTRLIGTYQKPVLVYVSATLVDIENNTETANQTLIVFPSGPVAVTENTGATNKFRRLSLAATANGYGASHTGAADSGLKSGLSLSANTWYYVYAVRVQYGDDAGNNFILVVDSTSPAYANHSTLNTAYGSNEWVYIGSLRYGFQDTATTTLVPFVQDHQGWTTFIDRGTANQYIGIMGASTTISSTSFTSIYSHTSSSSGMAVPSTMGLVKWGFQLIVDGDTYLAAGLEWAVESGGAWSSTLATLPFPDVDGISGAVQSFSFKTPNVTGTGFFAKRSSSYTEYDFTIRVFIEAVLDHFV